ncbi:MAG: ArgE/DapE family deacylase [bacterium]|jgi:acetylornithine deacetylase/succinyl-diaminopimelate desuccinylase family protein|nr:ArgE/DapE family deacylase [candidate division KSB1 bacterium]MDH7560005.1 ArgE/DapE family deacylase [bacterium]
MSAQELVNDYFARHHEQVRQEIVELTSRMVRERTVNVVPEKLADFPYLKQRGEEYRVAAIVTEALGRWGIPYEVYERESGRTNVVGSVGSSKAKCRLLVACHMDVVPPGDGWETDPFTPVERDGFLYGRGVLDNKGPLAASLLAARVLKQVVGDDALGGQFLVAALADEEASAPEGDFGIGYLLEEKLIHPTCAIIPDIGENMRSIDVAEKGRLVLRVVARGVQAHGSTPERGVNAVYKMARFVTLVEKLELPHQVHPVLGSPTVNLGEMHGGAAPNIVPGESIAYIDVRVVPGQTVEGVRQAFAALAKQIADDFVVEVQSASEPHAIDPNNALVAAIQRSVEKLLGWRPQPIGMGGGTFAKTLNLAGIPAVGFGPGDDTAFHVANERVDIEQLVHFVHVLSLVAIDLGGQGSA